jgi:cytochrome c553
MGFGIWGSIAAIAACALAGSALAIEAGQGASVAWAFPEPPPAAKEAPPAPEGGFTVPGSTQRYLAADLHNLFRAVDWFPERRSAAPTIVLEGRRPGPMACGYCHLPDGQGRPENAALAGLPAAYIVQQVQAFHDGVRKGAQPAWLASVLMGRTAQAVDADDVQAAAHWFEAQKYTRAFHLVEAQEIDAVAPAGGLYILRPGGGRESLGDRIVEIPNDVERFELRDNRPGFTISVPPGSIARGRALAETGGEGRFTPCAACHGAGLKGGLAPPLAGRYPAYLFRQLLGFSRGDRHTAAAAPMIETAAKLKPNEMVALAAYAASLAP